MIILHCLLNRSSLSADILLTRHKRSQINSDLHTAAQFALWTSCVNLGETKGEQIRHLLDVKLKRFIRSIWWTIAQSWTNTEKSWANVWQLWELGSDICWGGMNSPALYLAARWRWPEKCPVVQLSPSQSAGRCSLPLALPTTVGWVSVHPEKYSICHR